MNNIFQKNISVLEQKNPELAKRLQTYVLNEAPQLIQENNSYNFLYKNKYVHSRISPLVEAKSVFSMAANEPVAIHLIYGLGLGYLFKIACKNSLGTVILLEHDLNILWSAFTMIDFTEDILKENVYVTDNFDDASKVIYKKSGMKNNPQMIFLPNARDFDTEYFDKLVKDLQNAVGSYALDLKYTQEKFYPSLKMLIENIPNLMKEIPLSKLKDVYKGKTAVIVSAGPTLDRNIEILKKNRDKYILFTVGTAVKTLYENGIKPDFLCIIETYNSAKQVEGLDLSEVNFITEPFSNPALRNFKFKNIYSHISANTPINHFWSEICGENIEEYWSKGTVSYTALNSARLLGCSKIILVGQDLAYISGQCYSKDSAYKDLSCEYNEQTKKWEITAKNFEDFAYAISPSADYETMVETAKRRLSNLNHSLSYVKSITGDMIPTEVVYAAFVRPLTDYAEHFNDRKYINTSMVGAQIDGFENLPLEKALEEICNIDDISLTLDFSYDEKSIKTSLLNKLEELMSVLPKIEEGLSLANCIVQTVQNLKITDVESLKKLKELSTNYLYLSDTFSNESMLFDFMTATDKIDLDYEMKMMRDFTPENVISITNRISIYFSNAKEHIAEIENLIKGVINEGFNTKG